MDFVCEHYKETRTPKRREKWNFVWLTTQSFFFFFFGVPWQLHFLHQKIKINQNEISILFWACNVDVSGLVYGNRGCETILSVLVKSCTLFMTSTSNLVPPFYACHIFLPDWYLEELGNIPCLLWHQLTAMCRILLTTITFRPKYMLNRNSCFDNKSTKHGTGTEPVSGIYTNMDCCGCLLHHCFHLSVCWACPSPPWKGKLHVSSHFWWSNWFLNHFVLFKGESAILVT